MLPVVQYKHPLYICLESKKPHNWLCCGGCRLTAAAWSRPCSIASTRLFSDSCGLQDFETSCEFSLSVFVFRPLPPNVSHITDFV